MKDVKHFALVLIVCCGAAIAARDQSTYTRTEDLDWKIAQRFDDGRVVIMLSSEDAPIKIDDRDSAKGAKVVAPLPEFFARYLDGVFRADGDWVRRVTGSSAKVGDRWAIDGGRSGWFDASVSDAVIVDSGCQEQAAMMATVDSNRASFGRIRKKYFAARAIGSWTPPAGATRVGPLAYTVTDHERQNIERLLQQVFQRESVKLLDELGRDRHLPSRQTWQDIYARVSAGAARIRFDVQAFRLTPDALPRLYVRAVWNLNGTTVFMMGAWLRTAPALEIEGLDLHAARFPWSELFQEGGPLDPAMNGRVLNIADVDRDGLAEVLMIYGYYESSTIELSTYPLRGPAGPQVLATYGSGC